MGTGARGFFRGIVLAAARAFGDGDGAVDDGREVGFRQRGHHDEVHATRYTLPVVQRTSK